MARRLNSIIERSINGLTWFKVIMGRMSGWLGGVNFILLLAAFKQLYNISVSLYLIIPICIVGIVFFVWFDYVIILPRETARFNEKNDMKAQLNRIEKILEREFPDERSIG